MPLSAAAAAAAAADSVNRTMPDCFADRSRNNPEEMQRCPYLHEMKERLLSQPTPTDSLDMERLDGTPVKEPNLHNDYPAHTNPGVIPDPPEMPPDSLIGTVVKVHEFRGLPSTSPARHSSFHFRETYFHFLLDRVVVPNKTRSINRVRLIPSTTCKRSFLELHVTRDVFGEMWSLIFLSRVTILRKKKGRTVVFRKNGKAKIGEHRFTARHLNEQFVGFS